MMCRGEGGRGSGRGGISQLKEGRRAPLAGALWAAGSPLGLVPLCGSASPPRRDRVLTGSSGPERRCELPSVVRLFEITTLPV